jgi:ABC-type transporter Mla subunit MlaD
LKMLVPVADQFTSSTNNILSILSNQTTTGATINEQANAVRQAISGGADVASRTTQLLAAIQQPYAILAADSGPFLKSISQNPKEIAQLLGGLDAWAKAWTAAEASGPYLDLTTNVVVANPAVTNYLSAGLGPGYVNPPTYTSAGTIPTTTASARAIASAVARTLWSAPAQPMAEPSQARAVSQIVAAMSGSRPDSTAVSTLLLSPLLASLVSNR